MVICNKICNKCNVEKELNHFFKDINSKDGFTRKCKDCCKNYRNKIKIRDKEWNKQYYKNNKKEIDLNSKGYYQIHKKEHSKRMKKWFEINQEKSKGYIKEWRKNSINYKLASRLRFRLWEMLKKFKTNKSKSAIKLLDCSIQECKEYIEKQFKPEMNWNNQGKVWELDHIKGCCNFDLTKPEEQVKCFHYTNLQPLFKTSEIAKQNGYDEIGNRNKSKIFE